MKKIKIICDGIADIPQNLNHVERLPLRLLLNGKDYYDGVDITPEELRKSLKETDKSVKTSQVTYVQFLESFEKYINEGYEVLYIGSSSVASGTFQSARLASMDLPEGSIHLVDTMNLSVGVGVLVVKANQLVEEGKKIEEITTEIETLKNNINILFTVDDLEFLYKGGRISGAKAKIGTVLKVKPLLSVKDGLAGIVGQCRGKKQAIGKMVELVKENYKENEKIIIAYGDNLKEALKLKETLLEVVAEDDIILIELGASVCCHSGNQVFGLAFIG